MGDGMIHWIWMTGGVILCALEAMAPGMFLLWLGVAAIATGLVMSFAALTFAWSLLVFCAFAVVSVIIGRRFYGSRDQESDKPFRRFPGFLARHRFLICIGRYQLF